jgi:hypothetical protein
MRRAAWVLAAVIATAAMRPASAQSEPLAPTGGPPERKPALAFDPTPTGQLPPEPGDEPAPPTPAARAERPERPDRPPNVLGAPVMGAPVRAEDRDPARGTPATVVPASSSEAAPRTGRRSGLGAPEAAGSPVSADRVEATPRTSYNPADPVNDLLTKRTEQREESTERQTIDRGKWGQRSSEKIGDRVGDALDGVVGNNGLFRSDHLFDGFISPVTNPFLFEDPRSLTEARPIFMYQKIPAAQPNFQGGNIWFFGTQARLAVTDRLSFVFHKVGGISINPSSGSIYNGSTGFAELWLGPKYTFWRGQESCSLMAGGLQFQIPIGSAPAFQDTGSLSVVPYLTYAQNFFRDFRFGSFNTMIGTGYAFSLNDQRSDYYYLSAHLDIDVLNKHKFYPLVEANWLIYTTNGQARPISGEGRDLFNFGGQAKSTGMLSLAFGARYKITESAQIGAAFEFPLAGPKDIFQYRATIDFILRY